MVKQKKQSESNRLNSLKRLMGSLIGLISVLLLMSFFYGVFKGIIREYFLKSRPVFIKAVVIDKRNYNPNTTVSEGFSYSYRFFIDGKSYEGNAADRTLRVGDSVDVEYVRGVPSLNRAVHSKDW
jgi:hypothetical protein